MHADALPPLRLTAYTSQGSGVPLQPAPRRRDWLDGPAARAGKHCLPLLMANESGWELLNPRAFIVVWDGRLGRDGLTFTDQEGGPYTGPAHADFGVGIVTFSTGYVFRTSPGWNLLLRGPANRPKDGIWPLEGLVETDWSVATFTMNWQLTRPGTPVTFEEGEPFALMVPQPRGALEACVPIFQRLSSEPELKAGAKAFVMARREQHTQQFLADNGFAERPGFDRRYFRGRFPDDSPAPWHEVRRPLRRFETVDETASMSQDAGQ